MKRILLILLIMSSLNLLAENQLRQRTNNLTFLNSTTSKDLFFASIDYQENPIICTAEDVEIKIDPNSPLKVKDIKVIDFDNGSWAHIKATFYASEPVFGEDVYYRVKNAFTFNTKTNKYEDKWVRIKVTLTDQILLSATNDLLTPADKDEEIKDIVSYNNHFFSKDDKSQAYHVWNYTHSANNSFILDLKNRPFISDFLIADKGVATENKSDNVDKVTVSISDDKLTWIDYTIENDLDIKYLHIEPTQARYVKLTIDNANQKEDGFIGLFQVYGNNKNPNITNNIEGIHAVLNDNELEEPASGWKADKSHTHLFEFDDIYTIDQIDFFEYRNFWQSVGFPPTIDMKVEVSIDNKNWTTISQQKSTNRFKRVGLVDPVVAKYIRTTTHQKTERVYPGPSSSYWSLSEVRVFGRRSTVGERKLATAVKTIGNSDISIYPNPASNFIVIKGDNIKGDIKFYSIIGALVKEVSNYQIGDKIDITDLQSGMYLIKNSGKTYKIVVK
ncbi:T9SS type A sorting domain-containing protein [Halosquirtibacter xylanolyticus]|uniref:discoidin domain-containing protein n=1 Tax=Halosquirtibacter xylanolyticus TaxID=3374599 RepID=UPI00374A5AA5|nr:T9SS type A sorting domain-containing protein [Prolixibacteraceae bacterium]